MRAGRDRCRRWARRWARNGVRFCPSSTAAAPPGASAGFVGLRSHHTPRRHGAPRWSTRWWRCMRATGPARGPRPAARGARPCSAAARATRGWRACWPRFLGRPVARCGDDENRRARRGALCRHLAGPRPRRARQRPPARALRDPRARCAATSRACARFPGRLQCTARQPRTGLHPDHRHHPHAAIAHDERLATALRPSALARRTAISPPSSSAPASTAWACSATSRCSAWIA